MGQIRDWSGRAVHAHKNLNLHPGERYSCSPELGLPRHISPLESFCLYGPFFCRFPTSVQTLDERVSTHNGHGAVRATGGVPDSQNPAPAQTRGGSHCPESRRPRKRSTRVKTVGLHLVVPVKAPQAHPFRRHVRHPSSGAKQECQVIRRHRRHIKLSSLNYSLLLCTGHHIAGKAKAFTNYKIFYPLPQAVRQDRGPSTVLRVELEGW